MSGPLNVTTSHSTCSVSTATLLEKSVPLILHDDCLFTQNLDGLGVNAIHGSKDFIVKVKRSVCLLDRSSVIIDKCLKFVRCGTVRRQNVGCADPDILASLLERWSAEPPSNLIGHLTKAVIECIDAQNVLPQTIFKYSKISRGHFPKVLLLRNLASPGKSELRNFKHVGVQAFESGGGSKRLDCTFGSLIQNWKYCYRTLSNTDGNLLICFVNLSADTYPGNSSCDQGCYGTNQGLVAIQPKLGAGEGTGPDRPHAWIIGSIKSCATQVRSAQQHDCQKDNRHRAQAQLCVRRHPAPVVLFTPTTVAVE